MCRQVLAEFAPAMTLYIGFADAGVADGAFTETNVAALLPLAFGPDALQT
jgi:cytidine deaminase